MANAKFFLDRRRAKDKTTQTPLRIVIRHKDTSASISTNVLLREDQWDGKDVCNHPREKQLNILLSKQKADVDNAILALETQRKDYKTAAEVKEAVMEYLHPDREKPAVKKPKENLFIPFYTTFMEERNAKGTQNIYARALRWIQKYDREIDGKSITELDREWLKGLDLAMSKTNSKNTRSILLRSVRAVFKQAQDQGILSIDPFKGFDLKQEATMKRSMSLKTLQTIRDTPVAPWQEEYRDMFMLMFYLIGINAVDLFTAKKEQLIDGRLYYKRRKTGKPYSIKVQPEAMAIIKKYEGKNYLLSPMDRYSYYKDYLQHMNRALATLGQVYTTSSKKIGDPIFPKLSTYWSRHTWATLAYEIGIPVDTIGQALGHSDRQHTITFVYIRMDEENVDEANREVLDYVLTGERKKKSA